MISQIRANQCIIATVKVNSSNCSPLYLNIMLCEFFGQRSSTGCEWVDRVIDSHLAILVVQEMVYVFSALLKNPLPEQNRGGGRLRADEVSVNVTKLFVLDPVRTGTFTANPTSAMIGPHPTVV